MLYLILAICSSAMISVVMRMSGKYIKNELGLTAANYTVCTALAAVCTGSAQLAPDFGGVALWLGAVSGVLYLTSLLLLQRNVALNGVVLAATFMKLGVLVPVALSFLMFGERLGALQLVGFAAALAAILLIHFEGDGGKAEKRLLLVVMLLVSGVSDFASKMFEVWGHGESNDAYLFYTFLTALLLSVGLILYKKQPVGRWELLFGALVGVPNYFCSRFLLMSLDTVAAMVAFPTYSVGAIALVTAAGVLLFREAVSRRRATALAVIMAALVLLNL